MVFKTPAMRRLSTLSKDVVYRALVLQSGMQGKSVSSATVANYGRQA